MKLRELTENLDVNTPLYIGPADSEKVVFRRKHASDVIPESLLCMEVGTFFAGYDRLHIEVKRNSRKGSFRELLNCLSSYACIDVYVDTRDGTKEKVYSDRAVLCTSEEYDDCLVKRISPYRSEWGDKIEIEIEPCEEEKRNGRGKQIQSR